MRSRSRNYRRDVAGVDADAEMKRLLRATLLPLGVQLAHPLEHGDNHAHARASSLTPLDSASPKNTMMASPIYLSMVAPYSSAMLVISVRRGKYTDFPLTPDDHEIAARLPGARRGSWRRAHAVCRADRLPAHPAVSPMEGDFPSRQPKSLIAASRRQVAAKWAFQASTPACLPAPRSLSCQ
jgi:hypothetical protein